MIERDQAPHARVWAEMVVVMGATLAAYAWLLSPIMVDDVQRYIEELQANRFFWDLGHVWMQPIAMAAYRVSGGALGIVSTLEALNIAAVALGCGIFYETLRRCEQSVWRSAAATLLVAMSFNLLSLGPTAHIKLLVLPPFALALRHAVLWETQASRGHDSTFHAVAAGIWLGLASNLLVSVLPAGVFVAVLMLLRARLSGQSWPAAVARALPFGLALTLAGAATLLAAYGTATLSGSTTATSLAGFVFGGLKEKQDLHVGVASLREMPFRFAFSLINNFAYLPSLGPLGRAWLWGMLPDMKPVLWSMIGQLALAGLTFLAIGSTVVLAARAAWKRSADVLMAGGFVLGAAAFSFYYNLNDPEHWFQFTLPLVFLAMQVRRRWLDTLVLAVWLPAIVLVNLIGYGVPKATFALEQRQQEIRSALEPNGLYVGYAAYPGEPDSSLLELGAVPRFRIDLVQVNEAARSNARLFTLLDEQIDAAHMRKGRVLVFRALDPYDWRGPVMQVTLNGLSPQQLQSHLTARYRLSGPIVVGGFTAWTVEPVVKP